MNNSIPDMLYELSVNLTSMSDMRDLMVNVDEYIEQLPLEDKERLQEEWKSGSFASEFIKDYYKWNEDPEAFYRSLANPNYELYDEWSNKDQIPRAHQAVIDEIKRIEEQEYNKDLDKDGYFKIGTVELTVPPIQISVNETNQNHIHKTLRTSSDIIFQTGKSVKIVELDIYFHDIEEINNKLRPLLAQLKCSPFTPIYSEYLRSVLDPTKTERRLEADAERVKAINEANDKIFKRRLDLINAINKDPRLTNLTINPNAKPDLLSHIQSYWNGDLDSINSSGIDSNKTLSENMKTIMTEAEIPDTWLFENGIIGLAYDVENDVNNFKNIKNSKFAEMENTAFDKNIVGVLSQLNVTTVAGFPESLVCHATFFMFNYQPFSERFEFLDKNNKATTNIDKCLYFVQWYAARFLNQETDDTSNARFFKPLENKMTGDLTFEYIEEKEGNEGVNKPLPKITLDDNTVCAAVTVSQRNSISFLPVLQWSTPTCQYLGSHNSSVSLTIDTIDDDFMEKIKHMIDFCEKSTREGNKVTRANYIQITNEVLALLGIRNCMVNGIQTSTVPGSPGMTRMQINLIEFVPKQIAGETITRQLGVTEAVQLEYFYDDLQRYLDEVNSSDINYKNYGIVSDTNFRNIFSNEGVYLRAAGEYLIAKDNANYEIRNPSSRVHFDQDEKKIQSLVNVINEFGKRNKIERGIRVVDTINKDQLLVGKYTVIRVKDSSSDKERDYNYKDKKAVAAHIKSYLSSTSKSKRVDEMDKDILYLLYKADELKDYRATLIDNAKSAINATGSNLTQQVQDKLSDSKLLRDIRRLSYRYKDMDLPEYSTTKRVGKGSPKVTYSELGKPNPRHKPHESPRTDGDIVEPDFYFNNGIGKNIIDDINDKFSKIFEQEYIQAIKDISGNIETKSKERTTNLGLSKDDMLSAEGLEIESSLMEARRKNAIIYKDGTIGPSLRATSKEENTAYDAYLEERYTIYPGESTSDFDEAKRRYDKVSSGEEKKYYDKKETINLASVKHIYGLNQDSSMKEEDYSELIKEANKHLNPELGYVSGAGLFI